MNLGGLSFAFIMSCLRSGSEIRDFTSHCNYFQFSNHFKLKNSGSRN
jgi:hypothetical protein